MPTDVDPRPESIETGRSWRDLPPAPPTVAPPNPPSRDRPMTEAAATRSWPWGRIAVGALALTAGIAVGMWAPWSGLADTTESAAADGLPETIVPATPEELAPSTPPLVEDPPPGLAEQIPPDLLDRLPEDFRFPEDFFEDLPDGFLDQLPPEFFDGPLSEDARGLIAFGDLPEGFQVRSNVFSRSNGEASQRIRLLGPDGLIDVQAISGEPAVVSEGEPFPLGEIDGSIVTSERTIVLSWNAADDLLVTIEAPSEIDLDTLRAIAESVEVLP